MVERAPFLINIIKTPSSVAEMVYSNSRLPDTHWGRDEITSAVANEIFNGMDTSEFKPDEGMSWSKLAVVLHNLGHNPDGYKADFSDANLDKYYADAIGGAAENGIVSGNGDQTLNPQGTATRAQVAAMMTRFLALLAIS